MSIFYASRDFFVSRCFGMKDCGKILNAMFISCWVRNIMVAPDGTMSIQNLKLGHLGKE